MSPGIKVITRRRRTRVITRRRRIGARGSIVVGGLLIILAVGEPVILHRGLLVMTIVFGVQQWVHFIVGGLAELFETEQVLIIVVREWVTGAESDSEAVIVIPLLKEAWITGLANSDAAQVAG